MQIFEWGILAGDCGTMIPIVLGLAIQEAMVLSHLDYCSVCGKGVQKTEL